MSEQPVHDTNEMMRRRNQAVTEQLLGELEAGRFDSALTARILAAPGSFPRLLRGCYLALAGQLDAAREDVELALEHGRGNPVVELVAGMLLFAAHEPQRALAQYERAATLSSNAATRAAQLRDEALARLDTDAPHAEDAKLLEQAKRMLLRALAMYTGPRRS